MVRRFQATETGGRVSLVGAGPGHPDYLTLKGLRTLQRADVVVHDALLDKSFAELFPEDAKIIFAGKRAGKHSMPQVAITALLMELAEEGLHVVRLKGGDPCLFGRGGEEWLALCEANIPVEVVPGVSALSAVASSANFPVTHRGLSSRVVMLEGHEAALEHQPWEQLAALPATTLAIFMGTQSLPKIAMALLQAGKAPETPVTLVENGTLHAQVVQTLTLEQAAAGLLIKATQGPGMVYIGAVVRLQQQLNQLSPKARLQLVSERQA